MAEPRFEIYKDSAGKFRFRLVAPNGETIAVGEAYASKGGVRTASSQLKRILQKRKS